MIKSLTSSIIFITTLVGEGQFIVSLQISFVADLDDLFLSLCFDLLLSLKFTLSSFVAINMLPLSPTLTHTHTNTQTLLRSFSPKSLTHKTIDARFEPGLSKLPSRARPVLP